MRLIFAPKIEATLIDRRITEDDIRKVIEFAEASRTLFINRSSGHNLASLIIGTATYWVEYGREADSFAIYGAYTHRMKISQELVESPKLSRRSETEWSCLLCDRPLEWAVVKLEYLDQSFETDALACMPCQRVLVGEELAVGKMAMVEMLLEGK